MSTTFELQIWADGVVGQGTGPDPATLVPTEQEDDQ